MNRETVIQSMLNFQSLGAGELESFRLMIEKYPFFQTGHLLYLKALFNSEDLKFNSQLKYSAAFIEDRRVLYELLHEEEVRNSGLSPDKKTTEQVVDEFFDLLEDEDAPVDIQNEMESGVGEPISPGLLELDLTGSSYQLENGKNEENAVGVSGSEDNLTLEDLEDLIILDEPDQIEKDLETTSEISGTKKEPIPPQGIFRKKKSMKLIDSFLTENPSIRPKPIKDAVVNDLSKKSSETSDELITETLARIFVKQELYQQAIDAYQKLSLKFPEKNSYFASQIEEIKKLTNK